MREAFGVRYMKEGKLKQREFDSLPEARLFSEGLKRNMCFDFQIIRVYRENMLQTLLSWDMRWFGRRVEIWRLVAVLVAAQIIASIVLRSRS